MFRCYGDTGVDQVAGVELRPSLFCGAFECQLRQLSVCGVGCDGAVVEIGGGVVDSGDDEVVRLWDVLGSRC